MLKQKRKGLSWQAFSMSCSHIVNVKPISQLITVFELLTLNITLFPWIYYCNFSGSHLELKLKLAEKCRQKENATRDLFPWISRNLDIFLNVRDTKCLSLWGHFKVRSNFV